MKLALRGLLVLVVAGVVTQSGSAAPGRARLVTRPGSVIFWTPRVGLIGVGFCAPRANRCAQGAMERTTDGARTYRIVLHARAPITGIDKVGPYGAIVTSQDGGAWRTLDRGRTWRPFVYEQRFWANPEIAVRIKTYFPKNVQKLALSVTHDGGRTWRRLPDPCNRTVTYNIYPDLVTPKLWWLVCVGLPAGGTMEKVIFRTRDGGRTWEEGAANLEPPRGTAHGGLRFTGYPNGLSFARNGFGLLTESQGPVYSTRDGGLHFRALPKVGRPSLDYDAGSAAFSNGVGYVLLRAGYSERMLATRDFGRTWHLVRRWGS